MIITINFFRSKLGVGARAAYLLKAADILVTIQNNKPTCE